ncbi:MAG: efflux RND transporter permease subunit [Planctomycetales bacterium]|nr:efflux RND transporter permease subunit [Planctomycetales bacterium]
MRSLVQWAIGNTPGINVAVIGTLATGLLCFIGMRREVFPEFELDVVLVTVIYPGASPADTEKGVCQPVEEAVRALDGIKRLISIAREGGGYVLVELESNVLDVQKVVTEIRSRVDRITNFPELAEDPQVEQITFRESAIRLAIMGPKRYDADSELRLREIAEQTRDDLLDLSSITQATIQGAKPFQIDVEIAEDTLRKYGLTLSSVANILRRENIEMPGGQLKSDGQEILLRGKNRREVGLEIMKLPVVSQPNGIVLTIEDIGAVQDQFDDSSTVSEVNGRPALVISVDRTSDEDLLVIADAVHDYVDTHRDALPEGYSMQVWGDTSIDVRDRMRMLRDNGLQGLCFVFVLLALFLEFRLAFWVSLGIPICVMGAGIILLGTGQTLNMLSMFAFLMALGIVVDDAIVVGENIYAHRAMGKSFSEAAVDGTVEVLPSVTTAVGTTIIAFMPFFFVSGVMGKFIAVMPVAIIAMLAISLVEASTALPCHLSHDATKAKTLPQQIMSLFSGVFGPIIAITDRSSMYCGRAMDWFGENIYLPALRFLLRYPLFGLASGVSLLLITAAVMKAGWIRVDPFPKTDSNQILAQVVFPDGTPSGITDRATRRIEEAIRAVSRTAYEREQNESGSVGGSLPMANDESPVGPVKLTFRQVGQLTALGAMGATGNESGSHVGQVFVELEDAGARSQSSTELIHQWRALVGEIGGAERVTFDSASVGPGGKAIEFKLLAPTSKQKQLEAVVDEVKIEMAKLSGVFDIRDDATPGKTEFQIRVKDRAQSMGVSAAELAETIRNAYYGAEVMRLQRGRHEVKLMVRLPENERTSLLHFNEIRLRTAQGAEIPITELAEITVSQAYSEINRLDQQRSITVTADIDSTQANSQEVYEELQYRVLPALQATYPAVSVDWEGQQQQTFESIVSLGIGSAVALLAMYILLVFEFRSYIQPLLIMAIIPFGVIGAAWGHAIMGLEVTLFSFFGLVALTGVVVNDSIVLVDFINARVRGGMDQRQALLEAGRRRLRPVFLTSLTTIGGLFPMLLETSFQAQFLVPMATSIAFGLMLSTVLVLFQVPVFFQLYLIVIGWFGYDSSTQAESHNGNATLPSIDTAPATG